MLQINIKYYDSFDNSAEARYVSFYLDFPINPRNFRRV